MRKRVYSGVLMRRRNYFCFFENEEHGLFAVFDEERGSFLRLFLAFGEENGLFVCF